MVGTVMSLGMWKVATSKGHQLKPPSVRMERTMIILSFSSQTTLEEL